MKILFLSTLILWSLSLDACECECTGNCSFEVISLNQDFVALVKVISFDDYLEREILGHEGKMPYSMTVEIIRKYKGSEERKRIKIWGDQGSACRPYIANFNVGKYYLIAPQKIESSYSNLEQPSDYTFFSCWTDYLNVDVESSVASGNYSEKNKTVSLYHFEKNLMK